MYLSEELLHEGLCPAVVQFPALSGMADISRVQHQGQHFSLVYSDKHIHQSFISHIQTRAVKSTGVCVNKLWIHKLHTHTYTHTFTNKGHERIVSEWHHHPLSVTVSLFLCLNLQFATVVTNIFWQKYYLHYFIFIIEFWKYLHC